MLRAARILLYRGIENRSFFKILFSMNKLRYIKSRQHRPEITNHTFRLKPFSFDILPNEDEVTEYVPTVDDLIMS